MKNKILKLKEQYYTASDKDRIEIDKQMQVLAKHNPDAFASAMVELAGESADRAEELTLREQLNEIIPAVSLAYIAKNYFGKTRQWLYQRINGSLVNGKRARLNDEERKILTEAFKDIGNKLSSIRVAP